MSLAISRVWKILLRIGPDTRPIVSCRGASTINGRDTWRKHALPRVFPRKDGAMTEINTGDTAWLLVSTALVMLMTPGLALFYGGMVQGKNVLSTFMHSFFALGIVTLQWVLFGYSLSFGATHGGIIGGLDYAFLHGVGM